MGEEWRAQSRFTRNFLKEFSVSSQQQARVHDSAPHPKNVAEAVVSVRGEEAVQQEEEVE